MTIQTGWLDRHSLLRDVINILEDHGIEAYLVGGAVRDLLLGKETTMDLDFAARANGLEVARQVADALKAAFYPMDPERGVGRVIYNAPRSLRNLKPQKYHLDFATFRGPTLHEDLLDRDFTINAMALSISETPRLIDPLNGWQDLEARQIRATTAEAFSNDPVRILRAVRQAISFEFSIEAATKQHLQKAIPQLVHCSAERQRDELVKLLNTPVPGRAIHALNDLGALTYILPEVQATVGVSQSPPHYLDVFNHTTTALDGWAATVRAGWPDLPVRFQPRVIKYLQQVLVGQFSLQELMPLALLLHDTGKPLTGSTTDEAPGKVRFIGHERQSAKITRRVMARFRFSSQALGFTEKVVAHHMRPLLLAKAEKVTARAVHRLFRDTDDQTYRAGIAVALHALVDHQATYSGRRSQAGDQAMERVVNRLLTAYFDQYDQIVKPPSLINGRDIMAAFDIRQGRLVGQLLRELKEAQAMGQVNDRAEALAFLEKIVDSSTAVTSSDESIKD